MKLFNKKITSRKHSSNDKHYHAVVDVKRGLKASDSLSFMTSDIHTGVLTLELIDGDLPYNVNGCKVSATISCPDSTILEIPCEMLDDNIVEIHLGIEGTYQEGAYTFDLKIDRGNARIVGIPTITYTVFSSIVEKSVDDDKFQILDKLISKTKDRLDRFDIAMSGMTSDSEVREARDGENLLYDRLKRDLDYSKSINAKVEQVAESVTELESNVGNIVQSNLTQLDNRITQVDSRVTQEVDAINSSIADLNLKVDHVAQIDDELVSPYRTWSSEKIDNELNTLNKLHTSSVESHTTNNGIVDFTCDNAGYVDNVVIEGKTLVNLYKKNMEYTMHNGVDSTGGFNTGDNYEHLIVHNFTGLETFVYSEPITQIQQGKEYTLIVNVEEIVDGGEMDGSFDIFNEGDNIYNGYNDGLVKVKFTSKYDSPRIRFDANRLAWVKFKGIIILEGDHSDKPINYFEGLKSVGQGDKIGVLTYPTNNENLITSDVTLHEDYYVSWGTGELVSWVDSSEKYYAIDYIEVEPNTEYIFANINKNIAYYDANKTFIPMPLSEGYAEKNCTYFYNTSPSNAKYVRLSIKSMYIGKPYMAKGKYICDNKAISTTLRSLPNGVKDTIEKRGNKYVKVQRCEEIVIDNNLEVTGTGVLNQTLTRGQNYVLPNLKRDLNSPLYCNCLKVEHRDNEVLDEEHIINLGDGRFRVRVLKSKLSSDSLEGSSAYWNSTKPTIVYELETPIITELPNFNLQTYKGENTLIVNSGVIQCDASFDVCEGIRSELDVIKDKVSSLDDFINTSNTEILPLLNGFIVEGTRILTVSRNGNLCVLNGAIKSPTTISKGTVFAKLPLEYLPAKIKTFFGMVTNGLGSHNFIGVDMLTDGTLQFTDTENYQSNRIIKIQCVWEVE